MDNRPIGFLDSGVGGLGLWQAAVQLLPRERTVMIADGARFPYSALPPAALRDRTACVVAALLRWDVKLIVVACNTATVHALSALRAAFPQAPFVGVVPVVKTLAEQTRSGTIAVLATASTADSAYLAGLVEAFAPAKRVITVGCAGLADLVEAGDVRSRRTLALLDRYLAEIKASDADVLGLGCTHYLFLRPQIESLLGDGVRVYDPALPVARRIRQVLAERDALAETPAPDHCFLTSGDAGRFSEVASTLLGRHIRAGRTLRIEHRPPAPTAS